MVSKPPEKLLTMANQHWEHGWDGPGSTTVHSSRRGTDGGLGVRMGCLLARSPSPLSFQTGAYVLVLVSTVHSAGPTAPPNCGRDTFVGFAGKSASQHLQLKTKQNKNQCSRKYQNAPYSVKEWNFPYNLWFRCVCMCVLGHNIKDISYQDPIKKFEKHYYRPMISYVKPAKPEVFWNSVCVTFQKRNMAHMPQQGLEKHSGTKHIN